MSEKDPDLFESIYKRNFSSLCARVYAMTGDRKLSEDIVQDTFLKLWHRRASFLAADAPDAYLYQSVFFATMNHLNREKKRTVVNNHAAAGPGHSSLTPQDWLVFSETKHRLFSAIRRLPPRCREIFLLSRLHGFDYARIADRLQISPNTVEKHIVKALKRLRAVLTTLLLISPFA